MLPCRMIVRRVPKHVLSRSLASDSPGSKKPPKFQNRITYIKDKLLSFLAPQKASDSKTETSASPSSETPPNKSKYSEVESATPELKQDDMPSKPQKTVCETSATKALLPKTDSTSDDKDKGAADPPKTNMAGFNGRCSPEKGDCGKPAQEGISNGASDYTSEVGGKPCVASPLGNAALKKNNSYETDDTPTSAGCTEIAKLEKLHDPLDTDPEELLRPKDEIRQWRIFKSSTVKENDWVDLSATTGVPEEELKNRTVIISKAFKNVMQQGTDNAKDWEVQWDTKERWQNPLMGWASTADPLSNVKLSFATQLDAERWCTRNGWKYQVLPEREPATIPPKSYADNFSWNRRCRVSTK